MAESGQDAEALTAARRTIRALVVVFETYATFGGEVRGADGRISIGNAQCAKLARDCPGLLARGVTLSHVDSAWSKVRAVIPGKPRRLGFRAFVELLRQLGRARYPGGSAHESFSMLLLRHVAPLPCLTDEQHVVAAPASAAMFDSALSAHLEFDGGAAGPARAGSVGREASRSVSSFSSDDYYRGANVDRGLRRRRSRQERVLSDAALHTPPHDTFSRPWRWAGGDGAAPALSAPVIDRGSSPTSSSSRNSADVDAENYAPHDTYRVRGIDTTLEVSYGTYGRSVYTERTTSAARATAQSERSRATVPDTSVRPLEQPLNGVGARPSGSVGSGPSRAEQIGRLADIAHRLRFQQLMRGLHTWRAAARVQALVEAQHSDDRRRAMLLMSSTAQRQALRDVSKVWRVWTSATQEARSQADRQQRDREPQIDPDIAIATRASMEARVGAAIADGEPEDWQHARAVVRTARDAVVEDAALGSNGSLLLRTFWAWRLSVGVIRERRQSSARRLAAALSRTGGRVHEKLVSRGWMRWCQFVATERFAAERRALRHQRRELVRSRIAATDQRIRLWRLSRLFSLWLQYVRRCKKRRAARKRLLVRATAYKSRELGKAMTRAFYLWAAFSKGQGVMLQAQTTHAFLRWRSVVDHSILASHLEDATLRSTLEAAVAVAARSRRQRVHAAFSHWRFTAVSMMVGADILGARKALGGRLMMSVARRWRIRGLGKAWLRWLAACNFDDTVRRSMSARVRVSNKMLKLRVLRAWRYAVSSDSQQRKLRGTTLRSVCLSYRRRVRQVTALALSRWIHATGAASAARQRAVNVLHNVARGQQQRIQARAFRTWQILALRVEERHDARLRSVQKLQFAAELRQRRVVQRYLWQWHCVAQQSTRREELKSTAAQTLHRAATRMTHAALARAFNRWLQQVLQAHQRLECISRAVGMLRRAIIRRESRLQARAFMTWVQCGNTTERRLRGALHGASLLFRFCRSWEQRRVAVGWRKWQHLVISSLKGDADVVSGIGITERLLRAWRYRTLATHYRKWIAVSTRLRERDSAASHAADLLASVISHWRSRRVVSAWRTWQAAIRSDRVVRRLRATLLNALSRRQIELQLAVSWRLWRDATLHKRNHEREFKGAAFRRWAGATWQRRSAEVSEAIAQERRNRGRQVLRVAWARRLRQETSFAWNRWLSVTALASRAHQSRHQGAARLHSLFVRWRHRMLGRRFRQLDAHAAHSRFVESTVLSLVNRVAGRSRWYSLRAFRKWVDVVRRHAARELQLAWATDTFDRIARSWRAHTLSRGFRRLIDVLHHERRVAEAKTYSMFLLERISNSWRRAVLGRGFRSLREAVRTVSQAAADRERSVRAICRLTQRVATNRLARGFHRWAYVARHGGRLRDLQAHAAQLLCSANSRWRLRAQGTALRTWQAATSSMRTEYRCISMATLACERLFHHRSRVALARAVEIWKSHTSATRLHGVWQSEVASLYAQHRDDEASFKRKTQEHAVLLVNHTVAELRRKQLARGWRSLLANVSSGAARSSACRNIVCVLHAVASHHARHSMMRAWRQLRLAASERKHDAGVRTYKLRALAAALLHSRRAALSASFARWRLVALRFAAREGLAALRYDKGRRCVHELIGAYKRWQSRTVWRGWLQWRNFINDARNRNRTRRLAISVVLARWRLRVVSAAFHALVASATKLRERGQRQHSGARQLKSAVDRWRHKSLARGWATWIRHSSAVSSAQQTVVASTELRKHATRVLGLSLARGRAGSLSRAWRQWDAFIRTLREAREDQSTGSRLLFAVVSHWQERHKARAFALWKHEVAIHRAAEDRKCAAARVLMSVCLRWREKRLASCLRQWKHMSDVKAASYRARNAAHLAALRLLDGAVLRWQQRSQASALGTWQRAVFRDVYAQMSQGSLEHQAFQLLRSVELIAVRVRLEDVRTAWARWSGFVASSHQARASEYSALQLLQAVLARLRLKKLSAAMAVWRRALAAQMSMETLVRYRRETGLRLLASTSSAWRLRRLARAVRIWRDCCSADRADDVQLQVRRSRASQALKTIGYCLFRARHGTIAASFNHWAAVIADRRAASARRVLSCRLLLRFVQRGDRNSVAAYFSRWRAAITGIDLYHSGIAEAERVAAMRYSHYAGLVLLDKYASQTRQRGLLRGWGKWRSFLGERRELDAYGALAAAQLNRLAESWRMRLLSRGFGSFVAAVLKGRESHAGITYLCQRLDSIARAIAKRKLTAAWRTWSIGFVGHARRRDQSLLRLESTLNSCAAQQCRLSLQTWARHARRTLQEEQARRLDQVVVAAASLSKKQRCVISVSSLLRRQYTAAKRVAWRRWHSANRDHTMRALANARSVLLVAHTLQRSQTKILRLGFTRWCRVTADVARRSSRLARRHDILVRHAHIRARRNIDRAWFVWVRAVHDHRRNLARLAARWERNSARKMAARVITGHALSYEARVVRCAFVRWCAVSNHAAGRLNAMLTIDRVATVLDSRRLAWAFRRLSAGAAAEAAARTVLYVAAEREEVSINTCLGLNVLDSVARTVQLRAVRRSFSWWTRLNHDAQLANASALGGLTMLEALLNRQARSRSLSALKSWQDHTAFVRRREMVLLRAVSSSRLRVQRTLLYRWFAAASASRAGHRASRATGIAALHMQRKLRGLCVLDSLVRASLLLSSRRRFSQWCRWSSLLRYNEEQATLHLRRLADLAGIVGQRRLATGFRRWVAATCGHLVRVSRTAAIHNSVRTLQRRMQTVFRRNCFDKWCRFVLRRRLFRGLLRRRATANLTAVWSRWGAVVGELRAFDTGASMQGQIDYRADCRNRGLLLLQAFVQRKREQLMRAAWFTLVQEASALQHFQRVRQAQQVALLRMYDMCERRALRRSLATWVVQCNETRGYAVGYSMALAEGDEWRRRAESVRVLASLLSSSLAKRKRRRLSQWVTFTHADRLIWTSRDHSLHAIDMVLRRAFGRRTARALALWQAVTLDSRAKERARHSAIIFVAGFIGRRQRQRLVGAFRDWQAATLRSTEQLRLSYARLDCMGRLNRLLERNQQRVALRGWRSHTIHEIASYQARLVDLREQQVVVSVHRGATLLGGVAATFLRRKLRRWQRVSERARRLEERQLRATAQLARVHHHSAWRWASTCFNLWRRNTVSQLAHDSAAFAAASEAMGYGQQLGAVQALHAVVQHVLRRHLWQAFSKWSKHVVEIRQSLTNEQHGALLLEGVGRHWRSRALLRGIQSWISFMHDARLAEEAHWLSLHKLDTIATASLDRTARRLLALWREHAIHDRVTEELLGARTQALQKLSRRICLRKMRRAVNAWREFSWLTATSAYVRDIQDHTVADTRLKLAAAALLMQMALRVDARRLRRGWAAWQWETRCVERQLLRHEQALLLLDALGTSKSHQQVARRFTTWCSVATALRVRDARARCLSSTLYRLVMRNLHRRRTRCYAHWASLTRHRRATVRLGLRRESALLRMYRMYSARLLRSGWQAWRTATLSAAAFAAGADETSRYVEWEFRRHAAVVSIVTVHKKFFSRRVTRAWSTWRLWLVQARRAEASRGRGLQLLDSVTSRWTNRRLRAAFAALFDGVQIAREVESARIAAAESILVTLSGALRRRVVRSVRMWQRHTRAARFDNDLAVWRLESLRGIVSRFWRQRVGLALIQWRGANHVQNRVRDALQDAEGSRDALDRQLMAARLLEGVAERWRLRKLRSVLALGRSMSAFANLLAQRTVVLRRLVANVHDSRLYGGWVQLCNVTAEFNERVVAVRRVLRRSCHRLQRDALRLWQFKTEVSFAVSGAELAAEAEAYIRSDVLRGAELLGACGSRWSLRLRARAFSRWVVLVSATRHHHRQQESAILLLDSIAVRCAQRWKLKAWARLLSLVSRASSSLSGIRGGARLLESAIASFQRRCLKSSLSIWKDATDVDSQRGAAVANVIGRTGERLKRRAMAHWRDFVLAQRAHDALLKYDSRVRMVAADYERNTQLVAVRSLVRVLLRARYRCVDNAWRRWVSLLRELQLRESALDRVLAKSRERALRRGLLVWRSVTEELRSVRQWQATGAAVLYRAAERRVVGNLKRAMLRWALYSRARTEATRTLLAVLARRAHSALKHSVVAWQLHVQALRVAETVAHEVRNEAGLHQANAAKRFGASMIARVLQRLRMRALRTGLSHWQSATWRSRLSQSARSRAVQTIVSVLQAATTRSVHRCFVIWRQCLVQELSEAARLGWMRSSAIGLQHQSQRRRLLQVFHRWRASSAVSARLRHEGVLKARFLQRTVVNARSRVLSAAWSHWQSVMWRVRRVLAQVVPVLRRWERGQVSTAFYRLQRVAMQRRYAYHDRRVGLARCLRFLRRRSLALGLKQWRGICQRQAARDEQAARGVSSVDRILRYSRTTSLARAFAQWASVHRDAGRRVVALRRLELALQLANSRRLSRALREWRRLCADHSDWERRRAWALSGLGRLLGHVQRHNLGRSFRAWAVRTSAQRQALAALRRVTARRYLRLVRRCWSHLLAVCAIERTREVVQQQAVMSMDHTLRAVKDRLLRSALAAMRRAAFTKHTVREQHLRGAGVVLRVVRRVQQATLASAVRQWAGYTRDVSECRQRACLLLAATQRGRRQRALHRSWARWMVFTNGKRVFHYASSVIVRDARAREVVAAQQHAVVIMAAVVRKRRNRALWRAWALLRRHGGRSVSVRVLQSRAATMLGVVAERWRVRVLRHAVGQLALMAAARKALRRCLARAAQRRIRVALVRWDKSCHSSLLLDVRRSRALRHTVTLLLRHTQRCLHRSVVRWYASTATSRRAERALEHARRRAGALLDARHTALQSRVLWAWRRVAHASAAAARAQWRSAALVRLDDTLCRAQHRALSRAWRRWQSAMAALRRHAHGARLLVACSSRLQRARVSRCFRLWEAASYAYRLSNMRSSSDQQRVARGLSTLSATVVRLQRRRVARAWRAWARVADVQRRAERRRQRGARTTVRALSSYRKRRLARAWAWWSQLRLLHRSEAALRRQRSATRHEERRRVLAHLERVLLLQGVRSPGTAARLLSEATESPRLRRVALTAAFTRWQLHAGARGRRRAALRALLRKLRHAATSAAFARWRLWCWAMRVEAAERARYDERISVAEAWRRWVGFVRGDVVTERRVAGTRVWRAADRRRMVDVARAFERWRSATFGPLADEARDDAHRVAATASLRRRRKSAPTLATSAPGRGLPAGGAPAKSDPRRDVCGSCTLLCVVGLVAIAVLVWVFFATALGGDVDNCHHPF